MHPSLSWFPPPQTEKGKVGAPPFSGVPACHSQSPLETRASFRGVRPGMFGLIRSSTVTAAMALMLVEAVLRGRRRARGHQGGGAACGLAKPLPSTPETNLKVPLYAQARKRPGTPGQFSKMSSTM